MCSVRVCVNMCVVADWFDSHSCVLVVDVCVWMCACVRPWGNGLIVSELSFACVCMRVCLSKMV